MTNKVRVALQTSDVASDVLNKALTALAVRHNIENSEVSYLNTRLRNPSGFKHLRDNPKNLGFDIWMKQAVVNSSSGITNRAPGVESNGF